jgi:hypothetical protein
MRRLRLRLLFVAGSLPLVLTAFPDDVKGKGGSAVTKEIRRSHGRTTAC